MFIEENENGIVYMKSSKLPARHAFLTRYGGVSKGIFESLNLGSSRGDDPEAVKENYRRVCAMFGKGENDCAVTHQVHGSEVRTVTGADRHVVLSDVPYEADGIVTNETGLPLFCFVADCVPALLCDWENGVIGAVHCGWRSSVADILGVAIEKMEALGAKREKICAAMGASIGRCCFECDRDVPDRIEEYLDGDTDGIWSVRDDGKYMVDLREANRRRLVKLGLSPDNIDVSSECTYCLHDKYWSHRYTKGQRGNLGAVIML